MSDLPELSNYLHLQHTEPIDDAQGVALQVAMLTIDIASLYRRVILLERERIEQARKRDDARKRRNRGNNPAGT